MKAASSSCRASSRVRPTSSSPRTDPRSSSPSPITTTAGSCWSEGGAAPSPWHDLAMSLATRCTSCATAFRVVQDQLKVSEGWVRCGRCDAVFNALEGLFDLGRDAPADWDDPIVSLLAPRPAEPLVLAPADPEDEDDEAAGDDDAPASNLGELLADPIDAHLFGPRKKAEAAPKPAGQIGARDRVEFSDARFDSDLFSENASVPDTELIVAPVTDPAALPLESSVRPDFVRRADRRARWHTRLSARRAGRGRADRAGCARAAGRTPLSRRARGAVAAIAPAARRLVPDCWLQARSAAPDRRRPSRKHCPHARSGSRRFRAFDHLA